MKYSDYYRQKMIENNEEIDEKFCEFMDELENKVWKKFKISLLSLPDENYMDYYEHKRSPSFVLNKISDDMDEIMFGFV